MGLQPAFNKIGSTPARRTMIEVTTNFGKTKYFRSEKECLKYLKKTSRLQRVLMLASEATWYKKINQPEPENLVVTIKTVVTCKKK